VDWKGRYAQFRTDVPTFCAPFGTSLIASITHPDEVAYFRCRLCTDIVDERSAHGVYMEVEVLANPDNLSMAVVDFEAGGCSSVTFSPDTGAVIRERKIREAPRKVDGAYIQPLPTVPPRQRFHGLMGLYLHQGQLAFFRRCYTRAADDGGEAAVGAGGVAMAQASEAAQSHEPLRAAAVQHTGDEGQRREQLDANSGSVSDVEGFEIGPWETTGFVSDLSWAEGRRLTPCLAFRDEGTYHVRIVRVGPCPPLNLEHLSAEAEAELGWSGFDWEVGVDGLV